VVRLSGPSAHEISRRLLGRDDPFEPRRATLARFQSQERPGRVTDRVVATWFPAPHSYTTEDVVEVSAHGNPVVLRALIDSAIGCGARLARPGEFTLRAYLGGRIDLTQAEAVADLIAAVTPLQVRAASEQLEGGLAREIRETHATLFDLVARLEASLDFPDEGYHFVGAGEVAGAIADMRGRLERLSRAGARGRLIREGVTVAIVGRPNAGKSSLFNRLIGSNRAIVTAVPGTTRDVLTEAIDLGGLRTTLVDTAGLRETEDEIEAEGVRRAEDAAAAANVRIIVVDRSTALGAAERALIDRRRPGDVVACNKCDLAAAWDAETIERHVMVSALTGEGIDALTSAVLEAAGAGGELEDVPLVTNVRHLALIDEASAALERAQSASGLDEPLPEEFVLSDLHAARAALEQVAGIQTPDDLLTHIFSRFCVGK
jgi:tRNA modification GTPase